jgi:hypothetical protein
MKKLIIIISFFVISCEQLQRSPESGYADRKMQRAAKLLNSDQKSSSTTQQLSTRSKLQILESSLDTKKEIDQYSKMLPWFESDSEKIQFLMLGNFEQKQNWINQNNFFSRAQKIQNDMEELVQVQDIAVGMPQNLVKKSWGDPDIVEVSGNPLFKNERWRYNRYVSTPDGYKPEKKVVYFEGGKVIGWELE